MIFMPFISFYFYLLEWTRIPSTMLNEVDVLPCSRPQGKSIQSFTTAYILHLPTQMQVFCSLGSFPLICCEFLPWTGVKYYQMLFASICNANMIFLLQLVIMVDYTDWFSNIEPALHPWINPTQSSCIIPFMYYPVLLAIILLRRYAAMLMRNIGLQFSVFWYCLCFFLLLR